MATLFISDLHLDDSRPHITRLFVEFLERDAAQAEALYILGDLFEAWIGDDAPSAVGDVVAEALAKLARAGVPCFYMHGNRDFLLGDAFARRARLTLLPDPSVIEIAGERTLLMHGDTLCTDDLAYQQFRTQTRDSRWQMSFLALSVDERLAFAKRARGESAQHMARVDEAITDVADSSVRTAFATHEVRRCVHGHTHRPKIHRDSTGERSATERIVLGDWYEQGSMLHLNRNQELSELTTFI